MKGKIVSYDPQTGRGKLIIKNEGVKLFEIDNWIDYNSTPKVGMEVEFSIEGNKIVDITAPNSAEVLFDKLNNNFFDIYASNQNEIQGAFFQKLKNDKLLIDGYYLLSHPDLKSSPNYLINIEKNEAILYRNSVDGAYLLPIEIDEKTYSSISENDELEIDTSKNEIKNITKNQSYSMKPFPDLIGKIISAGGIFKYKP